MRSFHDRTLAGSDIQSVVRPRPEARVPSAHVQRSTGCGVLAGPDPRSRPSPNTPAQLEEPNATLPVRPDGKISLRS